MLNIVLYFVYVTKRVCFVRPFILQ